MSTHTTFTLPGGGQQQEWELTQARPLLNALVGASDFHFELAEFRESAARAEVDQDRVEYRIIVKSAIDQERPSKTFLWQREKLVVVSDVSAGQLKLPNT